MSNTQTEEPTVICTDAQNAAIERIRSRWHKVGQPQPTIGCNGAVAVQCFYSSGMSIWVCIETDGYAHS